MSLVARPAHLPAPAQCALQGTPYSSHKEPACNAMYPIARLVTQQTCAECVKQDIVFLPQDPV